MRSTSMPYKSPKDMESFELTQEIHGRLSELLAPATPESIRASSFRTNRILQIISFLGLVGFLLLILPTFAPATWNTDGLDLFALLGAAALGSTFYSLNTANRYLREGTFDPRYNQVYLVRYVLGIFAGFILGTFAEDLLGADGQNADAASQQLATIGPTALALVGGFSAEAVALILQRVADTLVTLVRGSDRDRVEAQADKAVTSRLADAASKLQTLSDAPPEVMQDEVKKIVRELTK